MASLSQEVEALSQEETEELVNAAFQLERTIKSRVNGAREAWWELAESLYELHEMRGWSLLGYDTLAEFLGQPEIELSRRSFFRAIQAWRDLAVTKQLPPATLKQLEPSKAVLVSPAVMRGDVKVEDAVKDAESLSYRDVVEKYSQKAIDRHGQKPDNSTPLDASAEPVYKPCPTCGTYVPESELVLLPKPPVNEEER